MSTRKKQPPQPHHTGSVPKAPAHTTPIAAGPQTDDVLLDAPITRVTIGDEGTVDPATDATEPLKTQSVKDGFTGAATTVGDNLEGGSTGLPRDPPVFTLAFGVMMQVLGLFTGFRTFMTSVKRPQDAVLVPGAVEAFVKYWPLLRRLVPGALVDINIGNITALGTRLSFVQTLLGHVGKLNDRLLAVQSHLEDQLVTQMRPLYDRCQVLFVSHDDLMGPMKPVVLLFTASGQKAAAARQNNQKVSEAAVAAEGAKSAPATPGTPSTPGTELAPGTGAQPGTATLPGPGTGAQPVKAPGAPPAPTRRPRKPRSRG